MSVCSRLLTGCEKRIVLFLACLTHAKTVRDSRGTLYLVVFSCLWIWGHRDYWAVGIGLMLQVVIVNLML